jgi:hypothetical protein
MRAVLLKEKKVKIPGRPVIMRQNGRGAREKFGRRGADA